MKLSFFTWPHITFPWNLPVKFPTLNEILLFHWNKIKDGHNGQRDVKGIGHNVKKIAWNFQRCWESARQRMQQRTKGQYKQPISETILQSQGSVRTQCNLKNALTVIFPAFHFHHRSSIWERKGLNIYVLVILLCHFYYTHLFYITFTMFYIVFPHFFIYYFSIIDSIVYFLFQFNPWFLCASLRSHHVLI